MTLATTAMLVVAIVILITALVYANKASIALRNVSGYDKDPGTSSAYTYLVWAGVVGWLSVIFIVGAILFSIFSGDVLVTGVSWALVLAIVVMIVVGILSAIAANKIGGSSIYSKTGVSTVYEDAIIAASATLGALIFVIIAYVISKRKKIRRRVTEHYERHEREGRVIEHHEHHLEEEAADEGE